ncbi:rhamnogalacturonan acetylesterase [Marinimicrobium locisalis]|uniref:rhamnogalacturonan acetylesterase n=1 Tax=Marinimicrobium locisalis TaxID=546022 RepID=UPI0032213DFD
MMRTRASMSFVKRSAVMALIAAVMMGCGTQPQSAPRQGKPMLFLAGDSTMADQPQDKYPEHGWGQVLPEYLNDGIEIENHARNGRSTKSFIDEGRWQVVLDGVDEGDFVVIGFGHNDQKDYDETRYAAPWSDYRRNLERMVEEVRQRGGEPILVTAIRRRAFDENGRPEATLGDYPEATRAVAHEHQVPLVDLNVMTRQMLVEAGAEGSADIYMQIPPGEYANLPDGKDDNTHLQRAGALRVAALFVESVKRQGLPLARYLKTAPLE